MTANPTSRVQSTGGAESGVSEAKDGLVWNSALS